jgi:tetratricopeptide (TPR) repeat protein
MVAQSQESAQSKQDDQDVRQRALSTVDFMAELIPGLPQLEGRISSYTTLGEILWRYDQPRSQHYFRTAFSLIDEVKIKNGSDARDPDAVERRLREKKHRLRTQVLRRIAAVDPGLAKQLIQQMKEAEATTHQVTKGDSLEQEMTTLRAGELIDLAEIFLESDPAQAVTLAKESLEHEVSPALPSLLSTLHESNPEAANQLFDTALQEATRSDRPDVDALLSLMSYVFPEAMTVNGGTAASVIDGERTTRLLNALVSALAASTAPREGSNMVDGGGGGAGLSPAEQTALIEQHLSLFQQYSPEAVPTLLNVSNQLSTNQRPATNDQRPATSDQRPVTSDQRPATNDPRARDRQLMQRAVSVAQKGGLDEAKRILSEIGNEEARNQARELIHLEAAMKAIAGGDFLAAHQYAQAVSQVKRRATIFSMAAEKLSQQGDNDHALSWLEEAYAYTSPLDPSREKVSALFLLIEATLPIDSTRAFQMTQSLVTTLNGVRASAQKDGAVDAATTAIAQSSIQAHLRQTFDDLGRVDFDQALYLAMQLQELESRILAELALCRGVLVEDKKVEGSS